MKASMHRGKAKSAKHNDRNFDTSKADHISTTTVAENIYWNCFDKQYKESEKSSKMTFEQSRLCYYKEHYSEALESQNDRHRKKGNHNRVKSMAQFMKCDRYAPTEEIIQIGKRGEKINRAKVQKATVEYFKFLQAWNNKNGNHLHILDLALHRDEPNGILHLHIVMVYDYTDENGMLQVGKEKALEQAGVPLPFPDEPNSRTNNRNITFTAICRSEWQKIAINNGFDIDIVPEHVKTGKAPRKHQDKENFIATQQAKEREVKAAEREKEAAELIQKYSKEIDFLKKRKAEVQQRAEEIKEEKRLFLEKVVSEANTAIEECCREHIEKVVSTAEKNLAQEISKVADSTPIKIIRDDVLYERVKEALKNQEEADEQRSASSEILYKSVNQLQTSNQSGGLSI